MRNPAIMVLCDRGNMAKRKKGIISMVTLTDDEVALIRSILAALRSIKVRDIDKAMVILSKRDRQESL
jgi:hypothetical protein